MPITVQCACGKQYPVKDEFAGHRVKCPDCGQVLTIPGVKKGNPDSSNNQTVKTLKDFQLEDADEGAVVTPPKTKKSGKGLLLGCLGCGCITVLFGMGLAGAGVGA